MNTLEAMIAVMLVLGLVVVVMQVQIKASETLNDAELIEKSDKKKSAEMRDSEVVIGEGRASEHDLNYSSYERWYF